MVGRAIQSASRAPGGFLGCPPHKQPPEGLLKHKERPTRRQVAPRPRGNLFLSPAAVTLVRSRLSAAALTAAASAFTSTGRFTPSAGALTLATRFIRRPARGRMMFPTAFIRATTRAMIRAPATTRGMRSTHRRIRRPPMIYRC